MTGKPSAEGQAGMRVEGHHDIDASPLVCGKMGTDQQPLLPNPTARSAPTALGAQTLPPFQAPGGSARPWR